MTQNILAKNLTGKVVILIIRPESYNRVSIEIPIKLVKDQGMTGIYVSMNKPYLSMKKSLADVLENIIFVDCASNLAGERPTADKLFLVNNPANLTDLSIAIGEAINKLNSKGFLVFDSLSTLLIYNPAESSIKFAHTIAVKMKLSGLASFLLIVDQKAVKEMIDTLSTVADEMVYLRSGEEEKLIGSYI